MNAVVVDKLTNIEWLGQQLRAKTANYEASTPASDDSSINWEERCGAIAMLPNPESIAYASILVWGDYRENTQQHKIVIDYISDYLYRLIQDEEEFKQRKTFDEKQFINHIARMELFYSLRPNLKKYHTLEGRLVFSGINYIKPDTYSKRYAWLGEAALLLLNELKEEIEVNVAKYRKDLNKLTAKRI